MKVLKKREKVIYDGVIEWIKYLGKFEQIDVEFTKSPKDFIKW